MMPEQLRLPRLYAILDVACFAPPLACHRFFIVDYARDLAAGGVTFLQYRNKVGNTKEMLSNAREIRRLLGDNVTLIMNDRPDICIAAGCDGVHVGQDDLSPQGARTVIGDHRILGVSTHNLEQVKEADAGPAEYVAYGPVFNTSSKRRPRSAGRGRGHPRSARSDKETFGRHRRHYPCECPLGDRRRGRLRGCHL